MPAGRFKPRHSRPPTTGQTRPPAGARGPAHARLTGPQKAAIGVGKAVEKGSVPVSHGVNRTVGRVLAQADREERAAKQKAARQQQAYLRQIGEGRPRTVSVSGRTVKPEPVPPVLRTLSAKPFHYEDISDFAVGKAATNLLFHGSTAHPGAAALELGTLLPIARPFRAAKEAIAGVREARAAGEAARPIVGGARAARVERAVAAAPERTGPSVPAMHLRLRELDKVHRKQLKAVVAQHAEIDPKMKQLVTAQRNMRRNKLRGPEVKNINREIADKAEGLMESAALKFPESEPGKLWHERQAIREHLNARAEQAFGPEVPEQGVMPFDPNAPIIRPDTGWKAEPLHSFDYHDGNDNFYYHVTTPENAARIAREGLKPGSKQAMAEGFYSQYSKGKSFLTERSGVKYWADRIEEHLQHQMDNPPDLVVVKIPKDDVPHALADEVGSRDRPGSFYVDRPSGPRAAGGAPPGEPPKPPAGFMEVPVGPWRDPEKAIQAGLRSAQREATSRKAAMSVARGERAQAMREAGRGLTGEERLYAKKGALKGKLIEDTDFEKFAAGVLPEEKYLDMLEQIESSPRLRDFEKTATQDALEAAYRSKKPMRQFEVRNMVRVFGEEAEVLAPKSKWSYINDVFGMSRSLQTTLDLSLNLRQALPLLFRNPKLWSKSIRPQIKVMLSEGKYREAEKLLHADPDMQEALKVNPRIFTSIEHHGGLDRPEFYPSSFVETPVPVKGVNVNLPGKVVRASGRAFETGQNLNIINSYKAMKARAVKWGIDISPDTAAGRRELEGMLEVAGAQSGRGIFKSRTFQGAQDLLGHGLYAPSYYKGRLTWFSPRWYKRLPKVARYEAIRTMAQFVGGSAAILGGAAVAGVQVGRDPRSADFAKIRIGNTRLDTLGGFQQWTRIGAQLMTMTYVDSNTGRETPLVWAFNRGEGFGDKSAYDVLLNFATGKASPPASFIIDAVKGTDYQHRDFEWKRELVTRMTPLVAQDMIQVLRQTHNPAAAAGAYLFAAAGGGVQTYRPREIKTEMADLRKAFLAENRKQGVAGLAPELEQQMKLHEMRYGAYRKVGLKSNVSGYQKEAFKLDLETLGKMGKATPAQRREWADWADRHTDDEISEQRSAWTREFFPTDWLNRAAKETGQKVPR